MTSGGNADGANWDRDYAAMAGALVNYVQLGTPLGRSEGTEIESIVSSLSRRDGAGDERQMELAVAWVLRNPQPLPLDTPSYGG